ncbi:dihydroneopterin aldolase [Robiginitalea sp. M366]|uniref:dihydroneopterin aldolase n=1 Tax=Robiginitalea aestuariiviva TaxID=3036903 RepID=UPI00240DA00A|nr:dihydroneopterin aldolase [Robiginitalea aestuariiviva]MDG1571511.1 dihydroneopterin aldolase [Robiginitalea aestuariiviva]
MGIIRLENVRLYGFHGCLKEEAKIGSDYRVDLEITADLDRASRSDQLEDTVDYVHLQRIIREEMARRTKLIETVAARILDRIMEELPTVQTSRVCVSKINPPIGGDVQQVTVELSKIRD